MKLPHVNRDCLLDILIVLTIVALLLCPRHSACSILLCIVAAFLINLKWPWLKPPRH